MKYSVERWTEMSEPQERACRPRGCVSGMSRSKVQERACPSSEIHLRGILLSPNVPNE